VEACAAHARARVPFWDEETIANELTDRGVDPLLRSYLWSYPAGLDRFVALAGSGPDVIEGSFMPHTGPTHTSRPGRPLAGWPASRGDRRSCSSTAAYGFLRC
jgi:hypothetical protein